MRLRYPTAYVLSSYGREPATTALTASGERQPHGLLDGFPKGLTTGS
jgi:hypothetical protein